jgi:hypothetical protein
MKLASQLLQKFNTYNNKYSFFYLSLFSLLLYRYLKENISDIQLLFIIYIPLLSELFTLGHFTGYYLKRTPVRIIKELIYLRIFLALILLIFWGLNSFLYIISLSLILSGITVYNNYRRQSGLTSMILNFEPNAFVILFLLSLPLNTIALYILFIMAIIILLYDIFKQSDSWYEGYNNHLLVCRINWMLRTNTGPIVQSVFFIFLYELANQVDYIYVWRVLVAATSVVTLIVRYLPNSTSAKNGKYFTIVNSGLVLASIVFLCFESNLLNWATYSFLLFSMIFFNFKYAFTIKSLVKSDMEMKKNIIRLLIGLSPIFLTQIFGIFNWYVLPLSYVVIGIFDYTMKSPSEV